MFGFLGLDLGLFSRDDRIQTGFQDLMGSWFFKGLDVRVFHSFRMLGLWLFGCLDFRIRMLVFRMLGSWLFGLGFSGFQWMSDIWLFGY